MDGGAWWAAVHGVAKSWTRLSNFTFTFHFYALEKEMAPHSSVLAWRIPGTGEPGRLPSMGLHRVRHDWSDLAAAAAASIHQQMTEWRCDSSTHTHTMEWDTAAAGIFQARVLEWGAIAFSRMRYYLAIKRMKFCHLQQHEWTRRVLCLVK